MQNFVEYLAFSRYFILVAVLICAVYQDIRYLKIKNTLTIPVLLLGLLLAILEGIDQLWSSLLGLLIPFAIGFIFFALRIFGAGDVKLMMALGALMGKEWILRCMVDTILSGGVLALLLMVYRGILLERLRYAWNYFKMLFLTKKPAAYQILDNKQKQFFPFAIAIACGSALACVFSTYA